MVSSGRRLQLRKISQITKNRSNQCPWLEPLNAGSYKSSPCFPTVVHEDKHVQPPAHESHQMFASHLRILGKDAWMELVDFDDPGIKVSRVLSR